MTTGLHTSDLANAGLRECVKCGQVTDDFPKQSRICKDCKRAYSRERARVQREADPEAYNQYQKEYRAKNRKRVNKRDNDYYLKHYMGLSRVEFDALLSLQGNRCAICERTEPGGKGRWHVDHDHACTEHGPKKACQKCYRGLLCFNCNVALGYLGDSPMTLLKAADYLMEWEN